MLNGDRAAVQYNRDGRQGEDWMLTPSYLTLLDPPGGNTEAISATYTMIIVDVTRNKNISQPREGITSSSSSYTLVNYADDKEIDFLSVNIIAN